MIISENPYFLVVNKPAGLNTHRAYEGDLGVLELLEQQTGQKLYVVHRLDKETTGVLIFAKSASSAAALSKLFENRKVKKSYFLISSIGKRDLRLQELSLSFAKGEQIEVSSLIEKREGHWVSESASTAPNSWTQFRLIKEQENFLLLEATPVTGRPHQIRLHAKDLGLPILGDLSHSGDPFPILCLHAHKLAFEEPLFELTDLRDLSFTATPPPIYSELPLLNQPLLSDWLFEWDQRKKWVSETQSLRLVHHTGSLPQIRIDKFGQGLWCYFFSPSVPQKEFFDLLEDFRERIGADFWICRHMKDRGAQGSQENSNVDLWESKGAPKRWTATESGITFEIRSDTGSSPGLFLDQRAYRFFVKSQSRDQRLLNLFCYTGGFSVNAALGGAKEVVSVDTSGAALDWAKLNFRHNQLDPLRFEFFKSDTFVFLKGCQKRGRQFDWVICDPPSFSRSSEGIFRIEKNYVTLLNEIKKVLAPQGKIFFSCNFEGWSSLEFKDHLETWGSKNQMSVCPLPARDLDFELPGTDPLLKVILLQQC